MCVCVCVCVCLCVCVCVCVSVNIKKGKPRDAQTNLHAYDIVVSKRCYYIYFWTNTLENVLED